MEQTFSLISNSGIQLHSQHIRLEWDWKERMVFHQWFDEETVENALEYAYLVKDTNIVVRRADLTKYGYLKYGESKVKGEEIISQPNILHLFEGDIDSEEARMEGIFSMRIDSKNCKIRQFFIDKWLPLPYFELGVDGRSKSGPYNWCRCKLTPLNDKGDYNMLLAFDTHTVYEEDEHNQCPVFTSDFESEKTFALCRDEYVLLDFFRDDNQWVDAYLRELVYPGLEEIDIDEDFTQAYKASYIVLVNYLLQNVDMPVVKLYRNKGVNYINVEMAIDMGNSRTSAVMFENNDFSTKAEYLELQNFSEIANKEGQLNRQEGSFAMRLAFRKVSFGDDHIADSTQFLWPSLVRLGNEAEMLIHKAMNRQDGQERLATYSSPKRYLWDSKAQKEEWEFVAVEEGDEPYIELNGVTDQITDSGEFDIDGMGFGRHYSRRSLMTFAFMEILCQANMQINSHKYRYRNDNVKTPRRLDRIILTCPTAMSKVEQRALHSCLKDAIRILNNFNMQTAKSGTLIEAEIIPHLDRLESQEWIFDESTCSQFVYLYGQIKDKYINNTSDFFNLYGKKSGNGGQKELTVGSLDIGAGTSDITICRYNYEQGNQSRIEPTPIYWDSFNFAGDDMLKILIETLILQGQDGGIEQYMVEHDIDDIQGKLYRFFGTNRNGQSFYERCIRRDFNIQILVPLAYYYLELLSRDIPYKEISFEEVFGHNQPNEHLLTAFKQEFGFDFRDIIWKYDEKVIGYKIEMIFDDVLKSIATILFIHKCDVVILSGRPTSLAPIKNIFLKYYSVSPDRLIVLNRHRVGRWYPKADESGYMNDSKSVVPVGAMIAYLAYNMGGLNGFSLNLKKLGETLKPTSEYFLTIESSGRKGPNFITPTENAGEIHTNSFPVMIGCRQFDIDVYPIRRLYVLNISDDNIEEDVRRKMEREMEIQNPEMAGTPLNEKEVQSRVEAEHLRILHQQPFTIKILREDYPDNKETLQIESVLNRDNEEMNARHFSLQIQSLDDPNCYWLDSGAFNINIQAR